MTMCPGQNGQMRKKRYRKYKISKGFDIITFLTIPSTRWVPSCWRRFSRKWCCQPRWPDLLQLNGHFSRFDPFHFSLSLPPPLNFFIAAFWRWVSTVFLPCHRMCLLVWLSSFSEWMNVSAWVVFIVLSYIACHTLVFIYSRKSPTPILTYSRILPHFSDSDVLS